MRCPKCKFISFDYLKTCGKCGMDLSNIWEELGEFTREGEDFSWFFNRDETSDTPSGVTRQEKGPVDLDAIDVSDLVPESMENLEELKQIDPESLEKVAKDKGFQQALNQVVDE